MYIYNTINTIAIINNTVNINPTIKGFGNEARSKFGFDIVFS
jgi:hypothetical protein